jgi:hypothetical protein
MVGIAVEDGAAAAPVAREVIVAKAAARAINKVNAAKAERPSKGAMRIVVNPAARANTVVNAAVVVAADAVAIAVRVAARAAVATAARAPKVNKAAAQSDARL